MKKAYTSKLEVQGWRYRELPRKGIIIEKGIFFFNHPRGNVLDIVL